MYKDLVGDKRDLKKEIEELTIKGVDNIELSNMLSDVDKEMLKDELLKNIDKITQLYVDTFSDDELKEVIEIYKMQDMPIAKKLIAFGLNVLNPLMQEIVIDVMEKKTEEDRSIEKLKIDVKSYFEDQWDTKEL